jgi:hypothetical protein
MARNTTSAAVLEESEMSTGDLNRKLGLIHASPNSLQVRRRQMASNVLRGGRTDFSGIRWPAELCLLGNFRPATLEELQQLAAGASVPGFLDPGVVG